jgi:hypothetical protein
VTTFTLQPFSSLDNHPRRLEGRAERNGSRFFLETALRGDLESLVIPAPAPQPRRRDNLWETTCFECFLAPLDGAEYWELNLSPSGHWQSYRFADYRRGREPDLTLAPVFQVSREARSLTLTLTLDLAPIMPSGAPLAVNVTAVLESQEGVLSYWALAHPRPEADFHCREGFVLRV